jgi:hypothetical protein
MNLIPSSKYSSYRNKIKPGDLISFSDDPSIVSRLISWRTNSIHTHSAMVIDKITPSGQRLLIVESLGGGPVPRYLSKRVQEYKGKVWHFGLCNATDDQREKACEWFWDKVLSGVKYDYFGLFTQAITKVHTGDGHLFCTEGVQMAWEYPLIIPKSKLAFNPGGLIRFAFGERAIGQGHILLKDDIL